MGSALVYYSRTGNTREVAKSITSRLDSPAVERIRPVSERRYAHWLAGSCIPGSRVPIRPVVTDPGAHGAMIIGTPKWTLSCPPVTEYIERAALDGVRVGLFLTYGGFDEDRYLRGLVDRLEAKNADVIATLAVKRDEIGTADCERRIDDFCQAIDRSRS